MMIHVFNGDAAADAFRDAGLDGEVVVLHEVLASGPAPQVSDEEWIALRARYIATNAAQEAASVAQQLRKDLAAIDAIGDQDVAIWAEYDLACQLAAAMTVARIGIGRAARQARVITAGDARPFRGLSGLSRAEFAHALERAAIGAYTASYAAAWGAYRSPDLAALESIVASLQPAPLRDALTLHLRRHPGARDPLGITDSTILSILRDGEQPFSELCRQFFAMLPGLGFGDLEIADTVRRLSTEPEPLVTIRDESRTMHVRATDAGLRSLDDASYVRSLSRTPYWLGGTLVG